MAIIFTDMCLYLLTMIRPFNVYVISEPLSSGLGLAASTHSLTNLPHLQFHFVFRRIQSLQLLLSDSPLSSAFAFDVFWAENFTVLTPLPFRFLTPAVSAFFRPPQFWILTTQPLFFLSFSSRFRLTVASPVPASALASSVSPFSPA